MALPRLASPRRVHTHTHIRECPIAYGFSRSVCRLWMYWGISLLCTRSVPSPLFTCITKCEMLGAPSGISHTERVHCTARAPCTHSPLLSNASQRTHRLKFPLVKRIKNSIQNRIRAFVDRTAPHHQPVASSFELMAIAIQRKERCQPRKLMDMAECAEWCSAIMCRRYPISNMSFFAILLRLTRARCHRRLSLLLLLLPSPENFPVPPLLHAQHYTLQFPISHEFYIYFNRW